MVFKSIGFIVFSPSPTRKGTDVRPASFAHKFIYLFCHQAARIEVVFSKHVQPKIVFNILGILTPWKRVPSLNSEFQGAKLGHLCLSKDSKQRTWSFEFTPIISGTSQFGQPP